MSATRPSAGSLEDLAQTDPVVARLAVVHALALRAADDPAWRDGLPELARDPSAPDVPLLEGRTLRVDPDRARDLLRRLVAAAVQAGAADAAPLVGLVAAGAVDPLGLLAAGLSPGPLAAAAVAPGVEPALLQLFARLLALPPLHAARASAAAALADQPWDAGYCPICGLWPLLAESRGLARERWLRCGGCAAAWRFAHHRCVFCGNAEHRRHGYLAAEAEREVRRAETCDLCRGYLKSVSTFGELDPADLAAQDMTTLELDVAALEAGYARPAEVGFRLTVRVEPLPRGGRARWGRLRWPIP